ncbi:uncharacterized protein LOC113431456, partial [Notechis scutatus]|uniref:Uncharacterized protein LOC113431456 n=1 Tax=Notechis scutatus TaxID=8663 RepID=A0A6J1W9I7_9SAUR
AKKKRRVTWAPGAVSQDGGMPFLEDFPSRPKRFKTSPSCVTEMEESVSSEFSEYDDQCMTASIIMPEEEWIPGSERNFTSKDFTESFQLRQRLVEERAEDTQLEMEKLLAYVKLQEDEVNTQKNLVLEEQQMFQKLEEEFKEETKKLKEKHLILKIQDSIDEKELFSQNYTEHIQKVELIISCNGDKFENGITRINRGMEHFSKLPE